jgi:hypothetical protein
MEIITRIPPAYFVHIEGDDKKLSQWINLAQIVSVNEFETEITIRLINDQRISLDGIQREKFLEEILQLQLRYRVTAA